MIGGHYFLRQTCSFECPPKVDHKWIMMGTNDRNDARHVKFDQPLEVRLMTIDGTWCDECSLINISDAAAQIELTGRAAELSEFFLMLTRACLQLRRMIAQAS